MAKIGGEMGTRNDNRQVGENSFKPCVVIFGDDPPVDPQLLVVSILGEVWKLVLVFEGANFSLETCQHLLQIHSSITRHVG